MIDCNTYDFVEIACMYNMALTITAIDGTQESGSAMTTQINSQRQECLVLEADKGNTVLLILEQIKTMTANQANPHFRQVNFVNNQVDKD